MFNFLLFFFFFNDTFECIEQQLGNPLGFFTAVAGGRNLKETLTAFKLDIDNRSSHLLAEIEPIYWIFAAGKRRPLLLGLKSLDRKRRRSSSSVSLSKDKKKSVVAVLKYFFSG